MQNRNAMQNFVERSNIANFTKKLETETDPAKRALLLQLLAEEEAKQASHPKDDKIESRLSLRLGRALFIQ